MDAVAIGSMERWVAGVWAYKHWAHLDHYTPSELDVLRGKYRSPAWLKAAMRTYEQNIILPVIGDQFSRTRLACVLREYPLPAHTKKPEFTMGPQVMKESIARVGARGGGPYTTVRRTLALAGLALKKQGITIPGLRAGGGRLATTPKVVGLVARHVLLTDLVKPFALFQNLRGDPFCGRGTVGKSWHTAEMYSFAAKRLASELQRAGAKHVLVFGQTMRPYLEGVVRGLDLAFVDHPARYGWSWKDACNQLRRAISTWQP